MANCISRRLFVGASLSTLLTPAASAELRPATLAGYQQYISKLETRVQSQNQSANAFLWADGKNNRRSHLLSGQTLTSKLGTPDVQGGLVQHWIGASFFPNASISQVLTVDKDYDRYKVMYAPDIIDSRLLANSGNRFDIFYRLKKKKVLTAVMDTKHRVEFSPLGPARHAIASRSTEVREVVDAGEPTEKILAVGEGQGFLWAMNSYWRMEESDGGVFVECEAVTLARSVPFGLGAVIGPIIESFAVESLKSTLDAKKRAVAARRAG